MSNMSSGEAGREAGRPDLSRRLSAVEAALARKERRLDRLPGRAELWSAVAVTALLAVVLSRSRLAVPYLPGDRASPAGRGPFPARREGRSRSAGMSLSSAGLDLIKSFEGLELTAYQDTGGVWTIGYGHTGRDVHPGLTITLQEAEDLLRQDVSGSEAVVNDALAGTAAAAAEFDAMVSLCFNVGPEFARSTVMRHHLAGLRRPERPWTPDEDELLRLPQGSIAHDGLDEKPACAADAFLLWRYDNGSAIRGLVRRRIREREHYLGGASRSLGGASRSRSRPVPPRADGAVRADAVLRHVETLRQLPESERSEFFDMTVFPAVDALSAALGPSPDEDALTQWLLVQSATLAFAVEGITEITYDVHARSPGLLRRALARLPVEQRARVERLLREFDGEETLPKATIERLARRSVPAARSRDRPRGDILGGFRGTGSMQSTRGFMIVQGIFRLPGADGAGDEEYAVNTGGGAANYWTTNGPVPPGLYRVSNHRPNRTTAGMVEDGVGYSFDLDPTDGTEVFGRSLFRIHPDGRSPGTNGCLGVRENADRLRQCEDRIVALLRRDGSFKIEVSY